MAAFLVSFLAGAVLSWILSSLELIPWRRAAQIHWTEQARRLFTARVAVVQNLWLIPISLGLTGWIFWPDQPWELVLLGGFLGAVAGGYPFDRATMGLSLPMWFRLWVATLMLQVLHGAMLASAVVFMPEELDWRVWLIAGVFLLVAVGFAWGWGLRVLQALRLLRPASPRLEALVQEIVAETGIAVRSTHELIHPLANAFAFVHTRQLVFTTRLLEVAPDDEIRAICRHELAHLSESQWTRIGRLLGKLATFPLIFFQPIHARFELHGAIGLALATVGIWFLGLRLTRWMEHRADRVVVAGAGDPAVYARALERLHRTNLFPAVMRRSRLNTHPDLYDRMIAANVTPDYPRPAPPSSHGWSATVLTVACTITALALFLP